MKKWDFGMLCWGIPVVSFLLSGLAGDFVPGYWTSHEGLLIFWVLDPALAAGLGWWTGEEPGKRWFLPALNGACFWIGTRVFLGLGREFFGGMAWGYGLLGYAAVAARFWTDRLKGPWKARAMALLLSLATLYLSIYVADHTFGLNNTVETSKVVRFLLGDLLFWVALLGLPLVFRNRLGRKDTWLNLGAYFLGYLLLYELCPASMYHNLLRHTGWNFFPNPVLTGLWMVLVALFFWGVQWLVLLAWERGKLLLASRREL